MSNINLTFHNGDLIKDSNCDIICHQVNCQGVMGSGIAKQIKETYPHVFEYYKKMCDTYNNSTRLLGCIQLVPLDLSIVENDKYRISADFKGVANLFGQEFYGTYGKFYADNHRQTVYESLIESIEKLAGMILDYNFTVGFPYNMGCTRGGGDWDVVLNIIKGAFRNYNGEVQIWRYDNG